MTLSSSRFALMGIALSAAGALTALQVRLSGHSILATLTPFGLANRVDLQFQEGFLEDMPYAVPHYLVDYAMRNTHVPVGFWRCVNHTQNCFYRESFIDELAHAAGSDPYQYRSNLIGAHKHADKFLDLIEVETRLVPAKLRNTAGIVGAALLARAESRETVQPSSA